MKSLYHKNKDKGRVYPSSSPNNNNKDVLTSLLPPSLLLQASVLSLEDREVLTYLITIKKTTSDHNKPSSDCGCFDCYTSFWSRWDSSPNRELIHQVVEAFEERLSERHDDELSWSSSKHRAGKKRKDKMITVRKKQVEKGETVLPEYEPERKQRLVAVTENSGVLSEDGGDDDKKYRKQVFGEWKESEEVKEEEQETAVAAAEETEEHETVAAEEETEEQVPGGGHKGLARMVLPDLWGILNSRLWGLWSPKV